MAPVTIGAWALVAAGSVVTKDVAPHALVAGVPAKQVGWVGRDGEPLSQTGPRVWTSASGHEAYDEIDGALVSRNSDCRDAT